MSSDVPPGVFTGTFTFSPKAHVRAEEVKAAVQEALDSLAAPKTDVEVKVEYTPTR